MNGAVSGGEAKQPIHVNRRKENADALADLAIENFIEMRDKPPRARSARRKNSITCSKLCSPDIYLPL
jgi:hypothetical protein